MKRLTFALLFCWCLFMQVRCDRFYYEEWLTPVYADSVAIHQMVVESPRPLKNTAKIYYKDSTIYIIEKDSGIHVIDNRIPANPLPIRFIKLAGCADVAMQGNIMYADNFTDLVVMNLANPNQPTLVRRIKGMYPAMADGKPAIRYQSNYQYYQCIDSTKGKVVGWNTGIRDTTKCYKSF
ncbi:MAG: hypothetical protein RIS64_277 [Bacteroidota bacterium]|jgi:hypothetical protein